MDTTVIFAKEMDKQDNMRTFKEEFYLPENQLYMDGNSLGLMSKRSEATLENLLSSWREKGIDGWTEGKDPWFTYSEKLSERVATVVGGDGYDAATEFVRSTGRDVIITSMRRCVSAVAGRGGTRISERTDSRR